MTPRQKKTLAFIEYYIEKNGLSPTIREMMSACGYKSAGSMHATIKRMIRDGYLTQKRHTRGIESTRLQGASKVYHFRGVRIVVHPCMPPGEIWVHGDGELKMFRGAA